MTDIQRNIAIKTDNTDTVSLWWYAVRRRRQNEDKTENPGWYWSIPTCASQQLTSSRDTKRSFISPPRRNFLRNIGYRTRPRIS